MCKFARGEDSWTAQAKEDIFNNIAYREITDTPRQGDRVREGGKERVFVQREMR